MVLDQGPRARSSSGVCVPKEEHYVDFIELRAARRVRGRRLLAVSVAFALGLTACSSNNQGASGPIVPGASASGAATPLPSATQPQPAELAEGGPEIEPTVPVPEAGGDLIVWNHFTGPDGRYFRGLVDKFNEEQQVCKASMQVQVGSVFNQQVVSAAVGNQLPHVLAGGYDRIPFLASEGVLAEIDELAQQAGYGPDMFPEQIWNAGVYAGKRYGIPLDTHPAVFFYNKALLEEAGVEPPTDRESFEAAIQAVNESTEADGYQLVGSGTGGQFLIGLQFATLFYQGGGEWTNEDYTEPLFNSQAGVDAGEYLASLKTDFDVPVVESDKEIAAFAAGTNAMVYSGIWESTRYAEALKDDLGIGSFPEIFGEGTWGGSHQMMVTTRGAEDDMKACSYYFIDWISANSYNWAEGGQVPARNEVREAILDADAADLTPTLAIIQQVAPVAEVVRFLPTIPSGGDLLFSRGAGEATLQAVNGTKDAKAALDEAAKFFSQRLKDDKEQYQY
jgi:multiple sugar transport system substrate-binding protein